MDVCRLVTKTSVAFYEIRCVTECYESWASRPIGYLLPL